MTYSPPDRDKLPAREDCRRCGTTGQFVTMIVNGKPKGPGGICYQCRGKGWLSPDDHIRNYWYDVKYRRVYA